MHLALLSLILLQDAIYSSPLTIHALHSGASQYLQSANPNISSCIRFFAIDWYRGNTRTGTHVCGWNEVVVLNKLLLGNCLFDSVN